MQEGFSPYYLYISGVWEDYIHMALLNEAPFSQSDKRPDGFIERGRIIHIEDVVRVGDDGQLSVWNGALHIHPLLVGLFVLFGEEDQRTVLIS